jgi:hypothetical protein
VIMKADFAVYRFDRASGCYLVPAVSNGLTEDEAYAVKSCLGPDYVVWKPVMIRYVATKARSGERTE